jgi:cytoskeleton protein RodZ
MADRLPGDFGRGLRAARERRGLSLPQVAASTKISAGVLEALERSDFARLPGGIFSRAFVRSYASAVGLDPDETVQRFIDQFPRDVPAARRPDRPPAEDHDAIESNRRSAMTFVRLLMLSVPIAGLLLYFGASGRSAARRQPTTDPNLTPEARVPPPQPAAVRAASTTPEPGGAIVAPEPAPASAVEPVAQAAVPVAQAAEPVPAADGPPAPFTVSLSATADCWVTTVVDGATRAPRLMRAGERETIGVQRDLLLTAGDASALAMTINGEDARPLGKAGQVVTTRIDAANIKEYLSPR